MQRIQRIPVIKAAMLFIFMVMINPSAIAGITPQVLQPAKNTLVTNGTLQEISAFTSLYIEPRKVQIWLPQGYADNQHRQKYAVLYMHDGQMLFDANITWNKQEWAVDEVAGLLQQKAGITPFIVVGVFNGGERRHNEYFPQKPFLSLTTAQQQQVYQAKRHKEQPLFHHKINSDDYLKFLVTELKPYIDSQFSVKTDVNHTFIMGSSMGGLISLYALTEYPDVFGGAACLSTHWPGIMPAKDNPVPESFYRYLQHHLPAANSHKVYFDFGTKTLDAFYQPLQDEVDNIFKEKGYDQQHWITRKFIGATHAEDAWRSRLHIPLTFLFSRSPLKQ